MNELLNQIEELYFLGGDLQEILMVAIEELQPRQKKIYIPWTQEEIEIANIMRKKGYIDKEIAWELGREPNHVSQKRYYMKTRQKAM